MDATSVFSVVEHSLDECHNANSDNRYTETHNTAAVVHLMAASHAAPCWKQVAAVCAPCAVSTLAVIHSAMSGTRVMRKFVAVGTFK